MKLTIPIKSQGFTLLEVLIAMIIFAVGMLGLAAMQGFALKDNNDAYLRSLAVFFAYDMGDRIRANPGYWDTMIIQDNANGAATLAADKIIVEAYGVYPFCSTDDPPTVAAGANPDPAVDCTNSQQLARYDWYRVRKDITDKLPNGALSITRLADPDGIAGVFLIRLVVSWNLTNTAINNITPSFSFDIRP